MSDENLRAKLGDLIERLEHEAYNRGWADAIQHVLSTAQAAGQRQTTVAKDVREGHATRRSASYGAVPTYVRSALETAADRGVTPIDVVDLARSRGENIAESSVRSRLRKLKIAGEVRNERGRWFLAQRTELADEQDASPTRGLALEDTASTRRPET